VLRSLLTTGVGCTVVYTASYAYSIWRINS